MVSEFNPKAARDIVRYLQNGMSREESRQLSRVPPKDYYDWIRRGRAGGEPELVEWKAAHDNAIHMRKATYMQKLRQHLQSENETISLSTVKWLCEKEFSETYGNKLTIKAQQDEFDSMPPTELLAYLEERVETLRAEIGLLPEGGLKQDWIDAAETVASFVEEHGPVQVVHAGEVLFTVGEKP